MGMRQNSSRSCQNFSKNKFSTLEVLNIYFCLLVCCSLLFDKVSGSLSSSTVSGSSDIFYFEIKENSKPNTFVGKVRTKAGHTYRFNEEPREFELDPYTGVIRTTHVPTDREKKDFYNLVIISLPAYPLEVKIRILDENDNAPQWPSYINTNLSFSESAPIGSKLIIDTAIDLDEGQLSYVISNPYIDTSTHSAQTASPTSFNNNNKYSLFTGSSYTYNNNHHQLPFKLSYNISTSFLHLEVSERLDREYRDSYVVNISAIDEGGLTAHLVFNVKIIDSNDNPPVFDQPSYSVSLNESVEKGVAILQVRATDNDEPNNLNSKVNYYLLSNDHFTIDSDSGTIYTAKEGPINCGSQTTDVASPDFRKVCVFTVFAHDNGTPKQLGRSYVTVTIIDSNDHDPKIEFRFFSQSNFGSVDENAVAGSVVAAVSVVDLDHGVNGETTLSIVDGNQFGHFRLDSITNSHIHVIRVNGSLDRETISRYNLTIKAADGGTPSRSSTAFLIINVNDVNDFEPRFRSDLYEVSLLESQLVGSFVASIPAVDLDEGINANLFYSINGPNSHYFRIDPLSGLVTTNKMINREEIDTLQLKVSARDGGPNPKWAHTTLKVTILDVNDETPVVHFASPVSFDKESKTFFLEIEENNVLDLTLGAVDRDLGPNGTVDITLLYDYDGLFQVDQSSNRLLSTKPLDYENCDTFKLSIMAADRCLPSCQLSSTITLVIKVIDKDDILPFVYPKVYFAFVPSNFKSLNYSIVVTRVLVRDSDFATPVNFIIHNHDLELVNTMFALNSKTGEIKLRPTAGNDSVSARAQVRNKFHAKHSLPRLIKFNVSCQGCQPNFDQAVVNVYIINNSASDVRREAMKREYIFAINEKSEIGSTVGRIDVDLRRFNLSMVSGDQFNQFELNRNIIRTNAFLDRELIDDYKIQLVASNDESFYHIDANINVIDVNDCHPVFEEKFVEIFVPADVPPRLAVYQLEALDPDLRTSKQRTSPAAVHSPSLSSSPAIKYHLSANPHNLTYLDGNEIKINRLISDVFADQYNRSPSTRVLHFEVVAIDPHININRLPSKNASLSRTHPLQSLNPIIHIRPECGLNNRLQIYAHIANVNKRQPLFKMHFHEISISESTAVNEQFLKISSADDWNTFVNYAIVSGNLNEAFGVFPDGSLYVRKPLDRETTDAYSLKIRAFDVDESGQMIRDSESANEDAERQCQVIIHVSDENDNAPIFVEDAFHFQVTEDSPINTLIGQVIARDRDLGPNSEIQYSIAKANNSFPFEIDLFSGYLWNKYPLDRERLSSFELEVVATDQSIDSGKLRSQVKVVITVLDINDNAPLFLSSSNVSASLVSKNFDATGQFRVDEIVVREDIEVGTRLLTVKAIDLDVNSQIFYRISNQQPVNYFQINNTSGDLFVAKALDREAHDQHKLIVAADDGKFESFHIVKVIVENVNDNKPVFQNFSNGARNEHVTVTLNLQNVNKQPPVFKPSMFYRAEVFENVSDSRILCVSASDADIEAAEDSDQLPASRLRFYFDTAELTASQKFGPFEIESSSGCIWVKGTLDYEHKTNYDLVVIADDGDFKSSATVHIKILDVNDNKPVFNANTPHVLKVAENQAIDSVIFVFKATDLDAAPNNYIQYEMQSRFKSTILPFSLGAIDGVLRLNGSLDREALAAYELTVLARDSGHKFSEINISIEVSDVNDHSPHFIQNEFQVELFENASLNTRVISLRAADLDEPDKIYYKIDSGDPYGHFKIIEDELVVAMRLDYEQQAHYSLKIHAIDKGGNFDVAAVNIDIINIIDELPRFIGSPYHVNWCENEVGLIGTFEAAGEADNQTYAGSKYINYLLKNNQHHFFHLNSTTGALSVVKPIDKELLKSAVIEIRIIAIDYRLPRLTGEGIIYLTIFDVNDNRPIFDSDLYEIQLIENHIYYSNESIGQVSATDADSSQLVKYDILPFSKAENYTRLFQINKTSGRISLKSNLAFDREQKQQYWFKIVATDGKFTAETNLTIKILDSNDCVPTILAVNGEEVPSSSKAKIDVLMPYVKLNQDQKEIPLFGVEVKDCDENNNNNSKVQFKLNKTDSGLYIDSSSGIIKCNQKFLSNNNFVAFEVFVFDMGQPVLSSDIIISLRFFNDMRHRRSQLAKTPLNSISVSENITPNSVIYTVEVLVSGKLAIKIVGGNVYDQFFLEHNRIKIKRRLDYETVKKYELLLEVTRTNKDYKDVQRFALNVQVINENDNAPTFRQTFYEVSVLEETDESLLIAELEAVDIDYEIDSLRSLLKYQITNTEKVPFTIDEHLGKVFTSAKIDRETNSEYDLVVSVEDEGGLKSTCKVHVTVEDKNDNPPRFTHLFNVNVTENAPIGTFVIQVTSSDKDLSQNAQATYNFIGETKAFKIEQETGKVYVADRLDREVKEEYMLVVSANDGSWKAQTTVTINILDENDCAPHFEKSLYEFRERASGGVFGRVKAVDLDRGLNSLIYYSFKHKSQYFTIDSQTGEISVKKYPSKLPLYNSKFEFCNKHTLIVTATDNGYVPRSSETTVIITVLPERSEFANESKHLKIPIPFDLKNGTSLFTATSSIQFVNPTSEERAVFHVQGNNLVFHGETHLKAGAIYSTYLRSLTENVHFEIEIIVTGQNLYEPKFLPTSQQILVAENEDTNKSLLQIKAVDNDVDYYNSRITYSLQNDDIRWNEKAIEHFKKSYGQLVFPLLGVVRDSSANLVNLLGQNERANGTINAFAINAETGDLYLTAPLDYELITNYQLKVIAKDSAKFAAKQSSTVVSIHIVDIDEKLMATTEHPRKKIDCASYCGPSLVKCIQRFNEVKCVCRSDLINWPVQHTRDIDVKSFTSSVPCGQTKSLYFEESSAAVKLITKEKFSRLPDDVRLMIRFKIDEAENEYILMQTETFQIAVKNSAVEIAYPAKTIVPNNYNTHTGSTISQSHWHTLFVDYNSIHLDNNLIYKTHDIKLVTKKTKTITFGKGFVGCISHLILNQELLTLENNTEYFFVEGNKVQPNGCKNREGINIHM